jgi:hypothetical protein
MHASGSTSRNGNQTSGPQTSGFNAAALWRTHKFQRRSGKTRACNPKD